MAIAINRKTPSFRLFPALCVTLLLAACAGQNGLQPPPGASQQASPAQSPSDSSASKAETSAPSSETTSQAATQGAKAQPEAATPQASDQKTGAATAAQEPMDRMVTTYVVKKGDDLLEIARAHDLGFLELRAANPGVDTWLPTVGSTIILPTVRLPAEKIDHGILINLAELRLYRFDKGQVIETHPLGIGREGLETPTGTTRVIRMAKNPSWYPTARMRKEKPELPAVVGPGPQNPLGNRAIYLGWDLYRIHGTNIPWGVGRRVSSGCIRMYPEDVEPFYDHVNVGMPVTVVNKRLVAAWQDNRLWVEVYPTADGWDALEAHDPEPDMPLTTDMVADLTRVVPDGVAINWKKVQRAVREHRGYPVAVSP